jgi:hypothetical protein
MCFVTTYILLYFNRCCFLSLELIQLTRQSSWITVGEMKVTLIKSVEYYRNFHGFTIAIWFNKRIASALLSPTWTIKQLNHSSTHALYTNKEGRDRVPLRKDCSCVADLLRTTNCFLAIYVHICLCIILAALPNTSALRASKSAICPALRNTFVFPIWKSSIVQVTTKNQWYKHSRHKI